MKRRMAWLFAALTFSAGCVGGPRPVDTNTTLGQVIVYRNGVAYFERYAAPGEEAIVLRVPTERVDDFLKSLSIVEEQTGKALAVSYPTIESFGGYVEMTVELPKATGRLRITYVTESPAWKPSYRVVLGEDGKARLLGWAVIDNVSGEDWDKVRVGVGSTSALSFRYDLHSIRLVERETLSTGEAIAGAPPTGGSPYAVATKKVRVVGKLTDDDLADMRTEAAGEEISAAQRAPAAPAQPEGFRWGGGGKRPKPKEAEKRGRRGAAYYQSLSQQLKAGAHRVRIEGYAQSGDADPNKASLDRANRVREKLVMQGVPADNIDVVATGRYNAQESVRILEAEGDGSDAKPDAGESHPQDTQPVGRAHFVSDKPLSIEADHSAMVSILNDHTKAERVYYYDPVSERGSQRFAFNAVRIVNPSKYTLDAGPFTVYAASQFLGEGLSEPILPGATAFIPYALDRSIIADPEMSTREEIDRLLTIQRGIVSTETRHIRRTKLTLSNRGKSEARVFVRHKVESEYELTKDSKASATLEKLGGAYLFPVTVRPGEALELVIEESKPLLKTVDIHTPDGVGAMALFLKKDRLEPNLGSKLRAIVDRHTESANLQERMEVLADQMSVYRTRIDEINVQLFTLKKVREANKLQHHLAAKMEEISEKLQQATMEMTDLQGRMMTLRIDLQDKLAELTLERSKDDADKVAAK